MKFAWFLSVYYYLQKGSYPTGATKVLKQKIRRHAANLEIRGEVLVEKKSKKEVLHDANIRKILVQIHEEGHLGPVNLYKQVKQHFVYYDGGLQSICKNICQECVTCQMRARVKYSRSSPARPIPTPAKLNFLWGCDAVGPLPVSPKTKNRYILTGIDYLTRWPVAMAVPNINELTTAEFYYSKIVCQFGVPNYILTDRGSNFVSTYTKSFLQLLGCRSIATTAFRAQCNGMCERLNQTLCRTIAKLARDKEDIVEWDKYVEPALLVIRSMENSSTGYSPAQLVYGQPLITPGLWSAPIHDYVEGEYEVDLAKRIEFVTDELEWLRSEARERSENAKARNALQYNKTVHIREPFKIGEQVLLKEFVTDNKFADKWRGPFVVASRKGDVYYLTGPSTTRIKHGVNGDSLRPFIDSKSMVPEVTTANAYEYFKTWVGASSQ